MFEEQDKPDHRRWARLLSTPRTVSWAMMAPFLVFTVAYYMSWGARRDIFATTRVEMLLGLVSLGAAVFALVNHPLRVRNSNIVLYAAGALFLTITLHMPFAADKVMSQHMYTERVVKCAMLTFFLVTLVRSPQHIRWFLIAFVFACLYVTQESVRGLISGGLVWENQGIMRLHGSVPLYMHPNSLAGVSIGLLTFVVCLIPVWRSWRVRMLLAAGGITSSICLLYSGSRTGYIALIALVMYVVATSRRRMRNVVVAVVLAIPVVAVLPDQYIERFESIWGGQTEGHSREMRIEILRDAVQVLRAYPLGVGVASFPYVRREMFGRRQDTHNLYLEVATNLGIQGLLIFLAFVGIMLARLRVLHAAISSQQRALLYQAARSRDRRLTAMIKARHQEMEFLAGCVRAVAGFLVVRMVLGLFGMDLYEVYWWFAAGLVVALGTIVEDAGDRMKALVALESTG